MRALFLVALACCATACGAAQTKSETQLATIVAECKGAQELMLGEAGAADFVNATCERKLKALDVDAGTP